MRAAIYQINSKYIHSSLASWYLCAAVSEVCDAVVLEGSINERDEVLFERIKALNCDAVCFSVYIWNVDTVVRLSKSVKQYAPSVKIILGGPEVAYRARAVLESYPYVD
ncbi:MAG: cobalamin B12-binding domain-containing protein, partial [Clostridia bacterium]|nr:cobalamin B12-binding domain-containing protein [Clostridia bacterium]